MQPDKKKDALTDLVDQIGSAVESTLDKPLKDGEAVTPSGEIVTMDFSDLAKKLLDAVHIKKSNERKVKDYLEQKKHLKSD